MHAQAYHLVSSRAVRRALDLTQEPERTRYHYGRHPFGQGLLLARRLIEAGTTLVQLNWHDDKSDVKSPFWDTHKDNFNALKHQLLPPVDVGLSAFLEDLDVRGLLASTSADWPGARPAARGAVTLCASAGECIAKQSGEDHRSHHAHGVPVTILHCLVETHEAFLCAWLNW